MHKNNKSRELALATKVFVGPMTLNVVKACIEYHNSTDNIISFLPSRRQLDFGSNSYTALKTPEALISLISKSSAKRMLVARDHAGPSQGTLLDNGVASILSDVTAGVGQIHIDPFKVSGATMHTALDKTIYLINRATSLSQNVCFEVGTEEAIFPYTPGELDRFLGALLASVPHEVVKNILFGVVQSGTSVFNLSNTGNFDAKKSAAMAKICEKYGLLAKEHNSDYLSVDDFKERIDCGVKSFNLAPEFGTIESAVLIDLMKKHNMHEALRFFRIMCFESGKWKRWGVVDTDQNKYIHLAGHYIQTHVQMSGIMKTLYDKCDVYGEVKARIFERLDEVFHATNSI
jgi:hypothetical protein